MAEKNEENNCAVHALKIEYLVQEVAEFKNLVTILNKLTNHIEVITIEMKHTREGVTSLSERVEDIEKKPVRLMDSIVSGVIMLIIGTLIGVFVANLGIYK